MFDKDNEGRITIDQVNHFIGKFDEMHAQPSPEEKLAQAKRNAKGKPQPQYAYQGGTMPSRAKQDKTIVCVTTTTEGVTRTNQTYVVKPQDRLVRRNGPPSDKKGSRIGGVPSSITGSASKANSLRPTHTERN